MPRIPEITYDNTVAGPVEGRRFTGDDFGAQKDAALVVLSDTIGKVTNTLYSVYEDSRAASELAKAQKRVADFTYGLQYGTQDDEGNDVAPPPPEKHYDLYQEEIAKVRQDAEASLGVRGNGLFTTRFNTYAERQGLAVRTAAAQKFQAEIEANTDEALEANALMYVRENDDLVKTSIKGDAMTMIDELQAKGVYTPQEAAARKRKFVDDAESGSILKMMQKSPLDVVRAIDRGEFHMNAEKLEHFRNSALREDDRRREKDIREQEHAEVLRRQREHDRQQVTFKDLLTLKAQKDPNFNPSTIMANVDNLSPEMYRSLLDDATGRGAVHSDPLVLADLLQRAAVGEDVSNVAAQFAAKGAISVDDMKSVMTLARQEGFSAEGRNLGKMGQDYIEKALSPNKLIDNPAQKIHYANATQEWKDWVIAHPKATREEAETEWQAIARGHQLVDFAQTELGLREPRFVPGGRAALNVDDYDKFQETLQATYDILKDKFEKKMITESEYKRELADLQRWKIARSKILQPKAKPKK